MKKSIFKQWWFWVGIIFVIGIMASASNEKKPTTYIDYKISYSFRIGSNEVKVEDSQLYMNQPMLEINDTAYIPVKFLLDALNAENVSYDANKKEFTFDLIQNNTDLPGLSEKYKKQIAMEEIAKLNAEKQKKEILKSAQKGTTDVNKLINEQQVIPKVIKVDDSFIYNDAYVTFQNKTKLVVKEIRFAILMFDENGYPVRTLYTQKKLEAINKAKEDEYKSSLEYNMQEAKQYLLSTDYKMTVDYLSTLNEDKQKELIELRQVARQFIRDIEK